MTQPEIDKLLTSIIDQYIASNRRQRWREFLLQKRDRGNFEIAKFYEHRDSTKTQVSSEWPKEVLRGRRFEANAPAIVIKERGALEDCYRTTLSEALKETDPDDRFVALENGKVIMFVSHEHELIFCKPNS